MGALLLTFGGLGILANLFRVGSEHDQGPQITGQASAT
jgi:hypothetical protein